MCKSCQLTRAAAAHTLFCRCQGFPDYYVLVGLRDKTGATTLGQLESTYVQVGNAVAPPLASALGECH